MQKRTLPKPSQQSSNDLVYFLASLSLFIIMALLASDSTRLFQ